MFELSDDIIRVNNYIEMIFSDFLLILARVDAASHDGLELISEWF